MKNTLLIILSMIIVATYSSQVSANCRVEYEQKVVKLLTSKGKVAKAGKITTSTVFALSGGFWGTMGVIMVGPIWAGALIGLQFGAFAAVPVGTVFLVINKAKKVKLKRLGSVVQLLAEVYGESEAKELVAVSEKVRAKYPDVSSEEIADEIIELNESGKLCDGSLFSAVSLKKLARSRQIVSYLKERFADR